MTERLKATAAAYAEHSLACPECSNPANCTALCEQGRALMEDFYHALQEAARLSGRKEKGDVARND